MAAGLSACTAALTLLLAFSANAQDGGKQAWTQAATSAALQRLSHVVTVPYQATPGQVAPGSVITQVYADREYAGDASVQSFLCWNGEERCVSITGRHINTQAFNGLDATRPMFLVHQAMAWRGSRPPIYVKGNVTVWYGPATNGAGR